MSTDITVQSSFAMEIHHLLCINTPHSKYKHTLAILEEFYTVNCTLSTHGIVLHVRQQHCNVFVDNIQAHTHAHRLVAIICEIPLVALSV